MKFYRTTRWNIKIEPIEADRETESCIFVGGRKAKKITDYECYYNTWREARDSIVARATRDHNFLKDKLAVAYRTLGDAIMIPETEP